MSRLLSALVGCLALTLVVVLPCAAEVTVAQDAAGAVTVSTDSYTVTVGADGYLTSIRAGETEFLAPFAPFGSPAGLIDYCAAGCFGLVLDTLTRVPLGKPELQADNVVIAKDVDHEVSYAFREQDFDIAAKIGATNTRFFGQPPTGTQMLLFASPSVTRSFDGVTDQEVDVTQPNVTGMAQEGIRWATPTGALLKVTERVDGYASFLWWGYRAPADGLKAVSFSLERDQKYTFTPLPQPQGADALHFGVEGPNLGLLMPGGEPLAFKITAENLTPGETSASVDFEIRDYLTRAVVASKHTELKLAAAGTAPVPADVVLDQPGPYRAAIAVRQGDQLSRDLEWVFTYDFPAYQPPLTRQPDFKEFWKQTLDDLAAVPLDVKMTLNAEKSTDLAEVYEVSLASLDGRRVWGYYSRPRNKEGKFPLVYFCPPTGVYPMNLWAGDGRGEYCTFNIAIHGFDLHLSDMKPDDPWRGYLTLGISNPQTSAWRWIYASLVRCMDFLESRPEVDQDRIEVSGSSQGGGLAMVLAGLDPRVDLCMPRHSGLPRLDWTVKYDTGYWPFGMSAKPEGQTEEEFLQTLSYFDAANFTPDIQCPVAPLIGMLDWVTASGNQICALAHLQPGQVELLCDPWGGHGSIGDRQVSTRFSEIENQFLAGQPVVLKPSK